MARNTYTPGEYLYLEGSPLLITSVSPLRGRGKGDIQVKLKRIGTRPIRSAEIQILSADGRELGRAPVENENENGITTSMTVISVSEDPGHFTVAIPRIILSDGTELLQKATGRRLQIVPVWK